MAVPVTGYVVASRRPENRIGWLFLVAGLAVGVTNFANQYSAHALVADRGAGRSGTGVCLAVQLGLDYPGRHAR